MITHTAGSSGWFERGFVTYSNDAKIEMLGVRPETLQGFGAVSPETAAEMAAGALKNSNATDFIGHYWNRRAHGWLTW